MVSYRLKEETEFKPKPMVLIGGKRLGIYEDLRALGYNDFVIALGYKGNAIKEYFLNRIFCERFTLDKRRKNKIHKNEIVRMRIFISICGFW